MTLSHLRGRISCPLCHFRLVHHFHLIIIFIVLARSCSPSVPIYHYRPTSRPISNNQSLQHFTVFLIFHHFHCHKSTHSPRTTISSISFSIFSHVTWPSLDKSTAIYTSHRTSFPLLPPNLGKPYYPTASDHMGN